MRVTKVSLMGEFNVMNNVKEWSSEFEERIDNNMKIVFEIQTFLDKYDFITASIKVHLLLLELNNFVHLSQFWLKKDDKKYLEEILCFTLEFVRLASILLKPFLPELMENIHQFLGIETDKMKIDYCYFRRESFDKVTSNKSFAYNKEFNDNLKTHGYFKIDLSKKESIFVTKNKNNNIK